ncbi:MAG: chromophore lyase CpcT/CpeT [Oscillatoriales cyanobacterium C42_A2020_001]|nr:chromophore lyase CpcT/CpeT [Leptolyngbyaceae cyanobacterium C42_A2020_001]
MSYPPELLTLAQYLSGEFENREQAAAEPVWYVHLRLWQQPVKLFAEDSVTIFAEQASVVNLDKPYRQRLLRLMRSPADPEALQVQYYGFKDPSVFKGAGQTPEKLESLTVDQVELLPGCILEIRQNSDSNSARFSATAPPGACCRFQYDGKVGQVALGFEVSADEYLTYDKGIDPDTGSALWGAIMGPYRYQKTHQV